MKLDSLDRKELWFDDWFRVRIGIVIRLYESSLP